MGRDMCEPRGASHVADSIDAAVRRAQAVVDRDPLRAALDPRLVQPQPVDGCAAARGDEKVRALNLDLPTP